MSKEANVMAADKAGIMSAWRIVSTARLIHSMPRLIISIPHTNALNSNVSGTVIGANSQLKVFCRGERSGSSPGNSGSNATMVCARRWQNNNTVCMPLKVA